MTMGQYKSHDCKALLTMLANPFFHLLDFGILEKDFA